MGARGPQKKPKLNAIAGTIQPAREFDFALPSKLKAEGRRAWAATVATLKELGLLNAADFDAVLSYCVAHDRRAEYDVILETDGQFYIGPNGAICKHPALAERQKTELSIERFQQRYGMTAVSREGLRIGAKKSAAPIAARKRG